MNGFVSEIFESVGRVALVEIRGILVSLEYLNPSGSIKDRFIKHLFEKVVLRRGIKHLVEATSGNTGISLAFFSALTGRKFTAVLPAIPGLERRVAFIKAYGGKVVRTPAEEGYLGAVRRALELPGYPVRQFENPLNPEAYEPLGRKLKEADLFVAGVGTGGTLIGVGRFLPGVAVFPAEKDHRIYGIGDGFLPRIYREGRESVVAEEKVSSEEAEGWARRLRRWGFFVGTSSGANFAVALRYRKRGYAVATVFPDSGDRYV